MIVEIFICYWILVAQNAELWKNPEYVVVSQKPLYIKASIDISKELIDAKGIDAFMKYYLKLVNEISRIFAWHNIQFYVNEQNFWSDGNLIKIGKTITETTPAYQNYVNNLDDIRINDIHILLVNINNTESNLGKSFIAGICTLNSYAIAQAGDRTNWDPVYAGLISAHEIGHSLGFDHVDSSNKSCNCAWGNLCAMNPQTFWWSQTYPPSFDSCNVKKLLKNIPTCMETRGNFPQLNPAVCGNNIKDEGEQCDCGFNESCEVTGRISCCDPKTCKLKHPTFQCDIGICCSACKFKRGNVCKQSTNECDLEDYCSGVDAYCSDNKKMNGVKCDSNRAYCMMGRCMTKNEYCKVLFPHSNVLYSDDCYKFAERQAAKNCAGLSPTLTNMFCGTGKGICGQVYCNGPPSDPFYRFSSGSLSCYTLLDNTENPDVNKVPPGGVCGPNNVCIGYCTSASVITRNCGKTCGQYEECEQSSQKCVPNNPAWFSVNKSSSP